MSMLELEDLVLAALCETARVKGEAGAYSLADIVAEFGETDGARIRELGRLLEMQGFVRLEGATATVDVRLLGWGSSHVAEWGLTDLLMRRRRG